ncbi:MAG: IclR family transcriptional regulator [Rhodocyclales bacterium]|nr:IclR family transcriptional regulator [Rhodocyclales bacterium]
MRSEPKDLPKAVVPSVLKATRLLDEVAASRDPVTLVDLSKRLALPKSSTLSLCTSLTLSGLLRRFDDGTYHLGAHLVDLAHAYLARTDLTKEFNRALNALKVLDEEGAVLAVRDGTDVVYIACRNGTLPIGVTYRIGMRLPVSCTATGKALISTLGDQEVKQLYRGQRLPRLTKNSCGSVAALLEQLHQVRNDGFARDDEETHENMYCIGVPIHDPDGGPVMAAVAVSMFKGRNSKQKQEQTVQTLKQLAAMLQNPLKLLR